MGAPIPIHVNHLENAMTGDSNAFEISSEVETENEKRRKAVNQKNRCMFLMILSL